MDCFQNVLLPILVGVSTHVLDYVPFNKRYPIHGYEFSWLNLHMLVVGSAYLFIAVFL